MKLAFRFARQVSCQALRARKYRLSKCSTDAARGKSAKKIYTFSFLINATIVKSLFYKYLKLSSDLTKRAFNDIFKGLEDTCW